MLLLFAFAVAAYGSTDPSDIPVQTALAATGAAVAWLLAVLGWFVHPDRPQRLAVAAALRELADLWEAAGTGGGRGLVRHRATAAVLQAYRTLVCALSVVHDRAAVRARRALAACRAASARAERALAEGPVAAFPAAQEQLASAVVELRAADDAAAGELWPAEIDPTELAAAERRAYLLLERFARPG